MNGWDKNKNEEDVAQEAVSSLRKYLEDLLPHVRTWLEEFPEPNEKLRYPAISITTGAVEFQPTMFPELLNDPSIRLQKPKNVFFYEVGNYDIPLQIDCWAGSKAERSDLYNAFFKAFNSQLPIMGLGLSLPNYYNQLARFDMTGFNYEDEEVGSQRREWRVKIDLLCNVRAILTNEEFAILETEIAFEPTETRAETLEQSEISETVIISEE